jgi:hypothetical protein
MFAARISLIALAAASLFAVVGCGSYQVVSTTPSGGEVMLDGPREDARERAEEYMGERCKFGYEIIDSKAKHPSADRGESRIAYRCKDVPIEKPAAARKEVAIRF